MGTKFYTNKQVAEITGLTPRQVAFYTDKEVVIKPGQGTGRFRQYTEKDIAEFGIIKMLFDSGIEYRPMKAMLRYTLDNMIEILISEWNSEKKFDHYLNIFTREDRTFEMIYWTKSKKFEPGCLLHSTSMDRRGSAMLVKVNRIFETIDAISIQDNEILIIKDVKRFRKSGKTKTAKTKAKS